MPLGIGSVVDERYRIDETAGTGGFGEVFRATDLTLGHTVALKTIHVDASSSAEARADLVLTLLEEARNLSRLRHTNVVAALDAGIVNDERGTAPYLVVEWFEGPTLAKWLDRTPRRGGLTLAETWAIVEPLTRALAHAHAIGIAHRDIKPSNVMLQDVGGEMVPRLIDFGIAKEIDPAAVAGSGATRTLSESSPHTPAYAAPEQVAGARTGPWTDVHALGLLFVELCTGKLPYGDGACGTAVSPQRPTPAAHGVDVGPFEAVIARALALRPRERYPDARALLQALDAAAASSGLPATTLQARSAAPPAASRPDAPTIDEAPESATIPSARVGLPPGDVDRAIVRRSVGAAARSRRTFLAAVAGAGLAATAVVVGIGASWPMGRTTTTLGQLDAREIEARVRRALAGVPEIEPVSRGESWITNDQGIVNVYWTGSTGHARLERVTAEEGFEQRLADSLHQFAETERAQKKIVVYALENRTSVAVSAPDTETAYRVLDELVRGTRPSRRSDGKHGAPPIDGI